MTARAAISIALLIAVIASGVACATVVDNLCEKLITEIESSSRNLDKTVLSEAIKIWESSVSFLSVLIPHEHVDSVSASLEKALAFLESGDEEEFYGELAEAVRQLKIVQSYDMPTIRAIF